MRQFCDLKRTLIIILRMSFLHLRRAKLSALFERVLGRQFVLKGYLVATMGLRRSQFRLILITKAGRLLNLYRVLNNRLALRTGRFLRRELMLFGGLIIALKRQAKGGRQDANVIGRSKIRLIRSNVIINALRRVLQFNDRVITRVIGTGLVIHARDGVNRVDAAAHLAIKLVLISTIRTRAIRRVRQPRPLKIALNRVIVRHRRVRAITNRDVRRGEGHYRRDLAFANDRLNGLALVRCRAARRLRVVIGRIPSNIVASNHPIIMVTDYITLSFRGIVLNDRQTIRVVNNRAGLFVRNGAFHDNLRGKRRFKRRLVRYLFMALRRFFFRFICLYGGAKALLRQDFLCLNLSFDGLYLGIVNEDLRMFLRLLHFLARSIVARFLGLEVDLLRDLRRQLGRFRVANKLIARSFAWGAVCVRVLILFVFTFVLLRHAAHRRHGPSVPGSVLAYQYAFIPSFQHGNGRGG